MRPGNVLKGLVVALTLIAFSASAQLVYAGGSKGGSKNGSKGGSYGVKIPDYKKIADFWICYAKQVQKHAGCIVKISCRESKYECDFYCRDSKKKKCYKVEQRGSKCSEKKWDGKEPCNENGTGSPA